MRSGFDGVFWRTDDGPLDFTALPPPPDSGVAKLALQIGRGIEVLVCPRCHGPMRLIAVIKDPEAIADVATRLP